jgi:hypothetical protein
MIMENQLVEAFKEKKDDAGSTILHHDVTGEPVFVLKKSYGRDVDIHWHPHQLEIHPDLASSFEHKNIAKADSKSSAINRSNGIYNSAAHSGFKDEIDHRHSYMSDEEAEKIAKKIEAEKGYSSNYYDRKDIAKITSFHDPDTGEKIGITSFDEKEQTRKFKAAPNYLDRNNISRDAFKNLWQKGVKSATNQYNQENLGYHISRELYRNKGKQPRLIGLETGGNGSGYSSYKVGTTPEAASTAHEEHITKKYPKATLTRHSPTAFTAIENPESYGGKLINSFISGNILHSTETSFNHPEYQYKTANTHIVESHQK